MVCSDSRNANVSRETMSVNSKSAHIDDDRERARATSAVKSVILCGSSATVRHQYSSCTELS